ncbi:MAG: hypothetical protein ABI240_14600 [Sphingomonas sp.]
MSDDYNGPDATPVPIGWFREAIGVAQHAAPGGYVVAIQLFDNGFEIVARAGDRSATERLNFFEMAMEAEVGNPFPRLIGRAIDGVR